MKGIIRIENKNKFEEHISITFLLRFSMQEVLEKLCICSFRFGISNKSLMYRLIFEFVPKRINELTDLSELLKCKLLPSHLFAADDSQFWRNLIK